MKTKAKKIFKPVKEMDITIEWVKNRTWGANPHAEAFVVYQDGSCERSKTFKCSGCGYDKESTVISYAFNEYLMYKLKDMPANIQDKEIPYGICNLYLDNPYYSGGIGTSCYYAIAEFIGGKFIHIASGKTFDVFKYVDGGQS